MATSRASGAATAAAASRAKAGGELALAATVGRALLGLLTLTRMVAETSARYCDATGGMRRRTGPLLPWYQAGRAKCFLGFLRRWAPRALLLWTCVPVELRDGQWGLLAHPPPDPLAP